MLEKLNRQQRDLYEHWKKRLTENPHLSMLSKQYRWGAVPISVEDARINDQRFGAAIDDFMNAELDIWCRSRTLAGNPANYPNKIVCIGAGNGLGLNHCIRAVELGMKIEVWDWLQEALDYAEAALKPIFGRRVKKDDVLKIGEATEVCSNLDRQTAFVELFRLVEHLPENDARKTLQGAGSVLRSSRTRVMIGDAFYDEQNVRLPAETCRHYQFSFVTENLEIGAGCPIELVEAEPFHDIEKLFDLFAFRRKAFAR